MPHILKGKIHWIGDKHYSSLLERGMVEEHKISFFVLPDHSYPEGRMGFEVEVLRKDVGTQYEGKFITPENFAQTGPVTCEVFQSIKEPTKYVLYGLWYHDVEYEWWAILK